MAANNGAGQTSLLALPAEIIDQICSHLGARSFLRLAATSRAARRNYLDDWMYWSTLVRKHFRFPNQPVVEQDGRRWRLMYKRLQTDTRAYAWGQAGSLGQSPQPAQYNHAFPPAFNGVSVLVDRDMPGLIEHTENVGAIVDLQCGGWSTVMLSSAGALYMTGVVNKEASMQRSATFPERLEYPESLHHPHTEYSPVTAINQFSVGRGHILAIADSGRLWSWTTLAQPAVHIKLLHHTTIENRKETGHIQGVPKKVVAGWSHSAALIQGTGIVLWTPYERETGNEDLGLVATTAVVPKSNFSRSLSSREARAGSKQTDDLANAVGEVKNFIMLENMVLFCTDIGKVFAGEIVWDENEQRVPHVVELPVEGFVKDIQGSFRRFALFLKTGAVLISTQDAVTNLLLPPPNTSGNNSIFITIPALQNRDVIQLAFGDWHFHALHKDGRITSYGRELEQCGALGLGGHDFRTPHLRGIRPSIGAVSACVQQQAYVTGRTVWFDAPKFAWLQHLARKGWDDPESNERCFMCIDRTQRHIGDEVSEWIEQEGRDWEHKYNVSREEDDGLPAYFTLSVAAAGWHSASLVLVNQDLAERVESAVRIKPSVSSGSDSQPTSGSDTETGTGSEIVSMIRTVGSSVAAYSAPLQPLWDGICSRLYRMFVRSLAVDHDPEPPARPEEVMSTDGSSDELPPVRYVWEDVPFPRLQLSNGMDMPGDVPFSTWRYGRPNFDHNQRFDI